MLIFGDFNTLGNYKLPRIDMIYNFNTLCEFVNQLYWLNPYRAYHSTINVNTNCYEFDQWYANFLSSDTNAFREFIDLMRHVYNGENVYVLCDFSLENGVNVIETLIKYILESYGYVVNIVHTPDDLDTLVEGEFSIKGIQLMDSQLKTYIQYFGENGLPSDEQ